MHVNRLKNHPLFSPFVFVDDHDRSTSDPRGAHASGRSVLDVIGVSGLEHFGFSIELLLKALESIIARVAGRKQDTLGPRLIEFIVTSASES